MAIEIGPARYLGPLREAAEATERVEIDYYTFGRDELTTRTIDPRAVFAAAGQWYVDAWCHKAGDDRLVPGRPGAGRPADGGEVQPLRKGAGRIAPGFGRTGRRDLPSAAFGPASHPYC